ncbi:MAG: 7-cyano-7-deazaguanine synthase QueC [Omnitrophica bacterium RIFOXYB12_FULL_50_7]|nr:MAG: 7-cyano-7-deazaguanine synthase QueC [Omnitrophica bacterium RIFOXYB12_FULL_50_7]
MKKAICLLSGGLDSAVSLYVACSEGYSPVALSIEYGQRHSREILVARALTQGLRIPHLFASLSMPWKGSALLDAKIELPKNRDEKTMSGEIPVTYVPGRNSVFLSMAMSCAETEKADAIFIGANILDYSGYPDCRPEYLRGFCEAMRLGTQAGAGGWMVEIKAPLIKLTKKDIVLLGQKLGVPFERTWSCYAGEDKPCGACDSCVLRAKGFREAGIPDPLFSV